MNYKITRRYPRGTDTQFAQFSELSDAKAFIAMKLSEDISLKIQVIYCILDRANDVIEEFDPSKLSSTESQSSQGQQSSAAFRPTPFNTSPSPSGMPKKWLKDDEDEKK